MQSVTVSGDVATLTLTAPLARSYDASTVTVNANAVMATNGQTVQEILGSGRRDQRCPAVHAEAGAADLPARACRRRPVHPAGVGQQPAVARDRRACSPPGRPTASSSRARTPAGNTVVQFGNGIAGGAAAHRDGQHPRRLPHRDRQRRHGQRRAAQPAARPPAGAVVRHQPERRVRRRRPATAGQIRASAPLPTLTIGRVVSLEDYQNYALAFAGIAKALASWTWFGSVRGVFLTVAGAGRRPALQPTIPWSPPSSERSGSAATRMSRCWSRPT